MITRPLDLSSHLRPAPRGFEFLFYVNAGLLALFFSFFGSRFVLAPGLGLDFRIPQTAGATAGATTTTHQITVQNSGQIFADDGVVSVEQLGRWLQRQKMTTPKPSLLVLASGGLSNEKFAEIVSVAQQAGFGVVWGALNSGDSGGKSHR